MKFIDSKDLEHFTINVQDKDKNIGKVKNLFIDDEFFYLRYLVVDTKGILDRNLVLLSPMGIYQINKDKKSVDVFITQDELENAPPLESAETVSEAYEKAYHSFFGWPFYWEFRAVPWGIGPYGAQQKPIGSEALENMNDSKKDELVNKAKESHLRSAKEIESYSIEATDGKFGHVESFLLDPKTLSIEYIVIDTINFLPSKNVLLRPEWIEEISWHSKTVKFPFDKKSIKEAPRYKKSEFNEKVINAMDAHFKGILEEKDIDVPLNDQNIDEQMFKIKKQRIAYESIMNNK